MHRSNVARDDLLGSERPRDTVADEIGKRGIVNMLQLAPAARPEMRAWRHGMMRTGHDAPIAGKGVPRGCPGDMEARSGDAIAARRDADNKVIAQDRPPGLGAGPWQAPAR